MDEPNWGFLLEIGLWLISPNTLVNLVVIELYVEFDYEMDKFMWKF